MVSYLFRRLVTALMVTLTISVITFVLLHGATDAAAVIAGNEATTEMIAEVRANLGLDRPLPVQYIHWLGDLIRGDMGMSYHVHEPVATLIARHIPATLIMAFSAIWVTLMVSLPLGIVAALRPNGLFDRIALMIVVAAQAIPNFWLGLLLILLFAVTFPLLPVSGDGTWRHFILPAVVLGTSSVPTVTRLVRAGLLDVLQSDYIRTARAYGWRGGRLMWNHALRNAALPVVSVLAIQLGNKLGGSVVTEAVFAVNGLGVLTLRSIQMVDIPTIQSLVVLFSLIFVVMTLLADVLNAWLDPRVRLS